MCGKTVAPESTRTQYDVAQIIGSLPIGDGYLIIEGCEYVAMEKKEFKTDFMSFSICNEWTMKKEALVAVCFYNNDPDYPGHALLINGTVFYDGDGGTKYSINYIDPSGGQEYRCSYEGFCDGSENGGWVPQAIAHSV